MKTLKQDDQVIKILDLKTINRLICYTDKGPLTLQIRKGENKYHLILDSVPLSNEDNKALMEVLFPVKEVEIPQVNKEPTHMLHNLKGKTEIVEIKDFKISDIKPKNKGGRPKKIK